MTPGNYGETFMQAHYPDAADHVIKISNYIGDSLDMALEAGAKAICLTGHIGKMVKIAGGIMNTHSRNGDARMEILAANAVLCGADAALAKEILQMKTTDAGIELLEQVHLTEKVMERLEGKINEGGIVVCEHEKELTLPDEFGSLKLHKRYKYGKIALTVYKKPVSDEEE
jgi:cobalt-precorrin-5B (C1)-methyltransferase